MKFRISLSEFTIIYADTWNCPDLLCIFGYQNFIEMAVDLDRHYGRTVEKLYSQRSWLILMANSYVQNQEASQDIVNDSFIALLENIDRLQDSVLKSFLATTMKNKCLNYLRRMNCEKIIHRNMKIKALDAYNMSLLESDCMDSRMMNNEVMSICRESLSKLPVMTSEIFMDRLRGLSYKEIAEKYGISHRSVTYEISKTLAVLKESLKDYLPLVIYLLMLKNN